MTASAVSIAAPTSPPLSDAVRALKLRASVERAVKRARSRDAAPNALLERAQRAQRLEARACELAAQEKWGAAARAGLRACEAEPTVARRWLQVSRWQRQDGDPFGAVETLNRASRFAPGHAILNLRAALCEALLECEEWDVCARECEELLRVAPQHHAILECLATARLQQGRVGEAVAGFRALLQLSPRDPLHRLKLAALLHLQGHLGQALREFERVEALSPTPDWAREAREAIACLDRLQIEGVMLCASRDDANGAEFRRLACRDLDAALSRHDFHLSEAGRETLRHLLSASPHTPEITTPMPRLH